MSESAHPAAKPAKSSLGKHALLLFMGLILFGNLYVIFSLRETLLSYKEKINDIQHNTNLISDRIYDLDARFTVDELKLSEARGDINEITAMLGSTQQEVENSSGNLAAAMRYINQLAEALNYEERLDFQEPEVALQEAAPATAPASQLPAVVDPQGSMEWMDPSGKKHTVQFRNGKMQEAVE